MNGAQQAGESLDRGQPFGTLLRRRRLARGLTQEELAEHAHLSRRSITDLERGVAQPRKDTLALLADALRLTGTERARFLTAARQRPAVPAGAPPPDVAASPLVGRAPELALLERHLGSEGPPLLLLAGEPGIGKTRLLHAAATRARGQGLRVLEGSCQRSGGTVPFGAPYAPLLGALERHLRQATRDEARTDLRGCAWLVRLLPELADGPIEPLPAWAVPPEQERRLLFAAVERFLTNVAGAVGTVLVLDDLQWAGPDALDLLAMLVRSAVGALSGGRQPLRVVGAYRDTEVGPRDPLAVLLADLAHAGLAVQRTLGPLRPEEAGQVLDALLTDAAAVSPELRTRVLQRTGGVPFFVVSYAHALPWEGGVGSTEDAVPWDVAQGVRQRVAALPAPAREILGVAAVLGRVVPPGILTGVVAQGERAVLEALDAASHAHLLVAQQDTYRFAHDVIREVVEADLGPARRLVFHRRIAQVLEHGPRTAAVEVLAYHYARSDTPARALPYLEQAGDRAQTQYAYGAAETYYREVAERLDALGRPGEAAGVREKLGPPLFQVARFDAALEVLEQAAATYHALGEREGLRRTLAQIGRMHAMRDTADEGLARLQPLVETLAAPTPSPGQVVLQAALAWLLLVSHRRRACVEAAERAADLARALGNERVLADVEVRRGWALVALGRGQDGLQVLEAVLPLAEVVGQREPGILSRVLYALAVAYKLRGEFAQSRRYRERGLALAEQTSIVLSRMQALAGLGELLFLQGAWEAAREHLTHAVDLSRSVGWSLLSSEPLLLLAGLQRAAGDGEAAARCLEERSGRAREVRGACPRLPAEQTLLVGFTDPERHGLLAEWELLAGEPDTARARLNALRAAMEQRDEHLHHKFVLLLAWAHLEVGEVAPAADLVAQAVMRARAATDYLILVDALRIQVMVDTHQERWAEAEQSLQEGLSLARAMPYPYAEARLLHVGGVLDVHRGAPEQARERWEEAHAIFGRLGARAALARVEQERAGLWRARAGC